MNDADPSSSAVTKAAPAIEKPLPPHKDPAVGSGERHVMWLDRQEIFLAWAGLASAFLIAIAFLAAAFFLIRDGEAVAGTVLGTIDLAALAAVFISGRIGKR